MAGRVHGPSMRNLICKAMRTVLQDQYLMRWRRANDQGRATECVTLHQASNHWIRGGGEIYLLFRVSFCYQSLPEPSTNKDSQEERRGYSGHKLP